MITPLLILSAPPLVLMALTAIGAHRRGADHFLAALSGLLFPLAWIAWFVADNHRAGRAAFRGQ